MTLMCMRTHTHAYMHAHTHTHAHTHFGMHKKLTDILALTQNTHTYTHTVNDCSKNWVLIC